jgi:hypothetical protein
MLAQPFGAPIPTGPGGVWFDSYVLNFAISFGWLPLSLAVILVAGFTRGVARWAISFSLTAALVGQCLLQALEYTVFLPLALFSLGLLYGHLARSTERYAQPI